MSMDYNHLADDAEHNFITRSLKIIFYIHTIYT